MVTVTMKGEWRCALVGSGGLFATMVGVHLMPLLRADNLATEPQVKSVGGLILLFRVGSLSQGQGQ